MRRLNLVCAAAVVLSAGVSAQPATGSKPTGSLLIANKGPNSVGIIDPLKKQQVAEISEGGVTGHEIAASRDGKLVYVPIYGNSGVGQPGTDGRNMVVLDLASRKVVGNVDFGKGMRPHCAVWGPKNGLLYVTTELEKSVSIIDPATLKIVGSVPTGQAESHMLAITRDGRRGYTANVGPGTISVLDLEARSTLKVIPVAGQIQRISLSVDDNMVFTSDVAKPQLAVIDTRTDTVKQWIALPGLGYGTAPTHDGSWLLVALPLIHKVAAVNLKTMTVDHLLDVPARPQEILVRPDGQAAYVSCDQSGKVAVINLKTWQVEDVINAGDGADGLAWASSQ